MHALMIIAVMSLGGEPELMAPPQENPMMMDNAGSVAPPAGPYHYDPPRDPQDNDGLVRGFFMYCRAWFQPMPQTCYAPHFGCYPGNGRDIQRYPAFHGYYYRQAYNYRPLYEYPWQAEMRDPLPLELNSERSLVGKTSGPVPSPPEVVPKPMAPPQSIP